jgi:hypothetical protein
MKDRLVNLLTILSLALLPVVVASWAWSYFAPATGHFGGAPVAWEVRSFRGELFVERTARPTWNGAPGSWHFAAAGGRPRGVGPWWLRLERMEVVASPPTTTLPAAGVPPPAVMKDGSAWRFWCAYWVPAALTGVLPALWPLRRRRAALAARRRAAGRCTRCGYDLRGTPDRCPECGTPGSV